jgi:hypothetical protein
MTVASPEIDTLWDAITAAGPRPRTDKYGLPGTTDELMREHDARETFRRTYAYAVPTPDVIARIAAFADGPIIEIGAGRGLWARLIQLAGGTVRVTDEAADGGNMLSTNHYHHLREGQTWTPVERVDAVTAARDATEPTLLTVWPSYAMSWAHQALVAFKGERVVYVGEGYDGCTADDAFHEELGVRWTLVDELAIPQWDGLHDRVYLYRRA